MSEKKMFLIDMFFIEQFHCDELKSFGDAMKLFSASNSRK